ncbi:MAG: glycosyltransferase family 4 protein [Micropruina sp.]
MRFHWYWPFARPEELDWATATARSGESIVVQVVDRPQAPEAGEFGAVTVVRDLPDVDRGVSPLTWVPSRAATYLRRVTARQRMWRSRRFDLVHLHYLNRFTDGLSRLPNPLVLSVHDVTPHTLRLGGRVEHAMLHQTYRRGDALIVHHQALRDRLVAEFGIDAARVHVVHHQVFTAPEVGAPPSDRPPMILFFGALRANKGLAVLLEAMRELATQDVRLVIAGRGDSDQEALARAAADADPRISAEIGFVPLERKWELFTEASLAVLPYVSFASQSGVLHDAYGHGRPVVVTDVGALGESVRADGTGLVAMPGDPHSLAEQITTALAPQSWRSFSLGAQAVRRERTPQRTGQRLREVYDIVLGGR